MTTSTRGTEPRALDPLEPADRLLRDLRSQPAGLSARESARRLEAVGPNALTRRPGPTWYRELGDQLVHPLALLLWLAAALAGVSGSVPLAVAIVVVIVLNALFAFAQERHAEKAVEALAAFLPPHARVLREGVHELVDAQVLVPGDVIVVSEGDRVSADARILSGSVEMDISALTGESLPVLRSPDPGVRGQSLTEATDVVFSGTACTQGEAVALVFATGMQTELGRIAALSQRVDRESSPLEKQVRRVARLIAIVAVGLGVAFIPLGTLLAGLTLPEALSFAIGLLVANVPEGLLPTITLALAMGVRALARRGALVKRLSAVETLGSTSVICTDKTGTLTLNRMRVQRLHTGDESLDAAAAVKHASAAVHRLARAGAYCTNATWSPGSDEAESGDATELALLHLAAELGLHLPLPGDRLGQFHFDPTLRRMTVVVRMGATTTAYVKGAPEEVLPRCTRQVGDPDVALSDQRRHELMRIVDDWASEGLRVLAVAERDDPPEVSVGGFPSATERDRTERELTFLGLVAMVDPPRPEVREAVARCHDAGIRLVVVTGDHGLTARGIAQKVGIGDSDTTVINGPDLDRMTEDELDTILDRHRELIFARSSPEAKLRIADALRAQGHVVAMTGDGVNDAPALRRADIGVAMGQSGTDVAREASTMVLTDDNFATIVRAVEAGRQVYDNVRKFIVYIFAHATPEVVPFLLYALSGGRVPLPLLVMQILAIDLGTETIPALALGREPGEPGLMTQPPRRRGQNVIDGEMLTRAWAVLGGVSAVLVTGLYLLTLGAGGWQPGDDVTTGPLNAVWRQATTMTFLAIVSCQIGTAIAARTQRASLRQVGLMTNPMLLWGIAFEVLFAAVVVTVPALQDLFGTALPSTWQLGALLPCPFIVWGADELWRWRRRRTEPARTSGATLRP